MKKRTKKTGKTLSAKETAAEEVKENSEHHKEVEVHSNREALVALIAIAVLVVIVVGVLIYLRSANEFEYQGLTFTREKFGDIPVYKHAYPFSNPITKEQYVYNFFVRIDPRENDVPVSGTKIKYPYGYQTYISVNTTNLDQCEDSNIAIAGLSGFLTNNLIKVKGATPDKDVAKEFNLTYASCTSVPSHEKVILIQGGDKSEVVNEGNCHTITAANCEILEAVEKFELQSVIDSRK